jgi:hypothetical protein
MRLITIKCIALFLCALTGMQKATAQVPVEKEAHHKIVLDNEWVRVLDGHVPPHDTTPVHIHSANSVVIFLSKTNLGIQVTGQQPVVTPVAPGDIRYVDYGDKPVTHIVWDQGDTMLRFLVVELKQQKAAADSCPMGSRLDIKPRLQQKQVSAYDWVVAAGTQGELPDVACSQMLIVPATGKFTFFPPNTPGQFGNNSQVDMHLILLEIR